MSKPIKQFDPQTMFEQTLNEVDIKVAEISAAFDRLQWLRGKLADQFEAMQAAADAFELFTEEQAAMMLQIKPDHLGSMRRNLDLPHVKLGDKVRYTKGHLNAICDAMSINSKGKAAMVRKAA